MKLALSFSIPLAVVISVLGGSLNAQTIDFETIPGVGVPTEGLVIDTQFQASHGITFSLEGGGAPHVAEVGDPPTAFGGPPNDSASDTPAPGQGVGTFFLTDDGLFAGLFAPALLIHYNPPTDSASGVILDMDHGETFTIQLRDATDLLLDEFVITAGDPGTGDGIATPWSFTRATSDVFSVRMKGVRTASGVFGLGFDNFDARFANPCPFPASTTPRNGSGINPVGFFEVSPAIMGGSWDTVVDIGTPGALSSVVAICTGGPTSGIVLTGNVHGEVLCLAPFLKLDSSLTGNHSIPVPLDCAFAGITVWAQAATIKPQDIALNNALDVTVGSF